MKHYSAINSGQSHNDQIRNLWAAVINQAIDDLTCRAQNGKISDGAKWWFTGKNTGFEEICEAFDWDPGNIRTGIRDLLVMKIDKIQPRRPGRKKIGGTCSVPGCNLPHQAKGMCKMHYMRQYAREKYYREKKAKS